MNSKFNQRIKIVLFGVAPGLIFLLAWEWFGLSTERRTFLFASPSMVWNVAIDDVLAGIIYVHLKATLIVTILGLVIGSVAGTLTGFSLWVDPRVGRIAMPYVVVVGAIPIFAIAPLLIIWFGTGLVAKVFMASSTVFVVSLVSGYNTANRLMRAHEDWLHGLNVPRNISLRYVIFPEAVRSIFEVARLNIGFAILGAFIAEFISSNQGIGFYILKSSGLFDTARVLFGVCLLGCMALCITWMLHTLEKYTPALRYSKSRIGE